MAKEVMVRHASDNEYFHRDFHISLNRGIEHLRNNFGEEHVIEYLRRFARAYYSPLKAEIRKSGLDGVKAHFDKLYAVEKASDALTIAVDKGIMTVDISYCPAVKHIRSANVQPSPMYVETTRTVWAEICSDTQIRFELISYDEETGAAKLVFKEVQR